MLRWWARCPKTARFKNRGWSRLQHFAGAATPSCSAFSTRQLGVRTLGFTQDRTRGRFCRFRSTDGSTTNTILDHHGGEAFTLGGAVKELLPRATRYSRATQYSLWGLSLATAQEIPFRSMPLLHCKSKQGRQVPPLFQGQGNIPSSTRLMLMFPPINPPVRA